MTIQVTGKNMETGDAFQSYVTDKARTVLEKYIGPEISGYIRIEKIKAQFHTHCSMRLKTGLMLNHRARQTTPSPARTPLWSVWKNVSAAISVA